ncbi:MAG TPA: zf-HC2 domain-containing protein [Solirubrobacterales bacterium]|nr:zf-HC2 domain-containing protein [Solirubrobacterales bacterium]
MRTEGCREWRESLGAYVLGQLPEGERAGLEAHLEGCAECRAELAELEPVARVMPLAEPERFAEPPRPPAGLGKRIEATIAAERRAAGRRRRRRFGLVLGGATAAAAAAAVLAAFVLGGGSSASPEQRVAFSSLPPGIKIAATLEPRAYGTEVHMYVEGVRSGTLCRVVLRGPHGARLPAGTFRYRYGEDEAVLSSALDLSRTTSIVVHVGDRAFAAPV